MELVESLFSIILPIHIGSVFITLGIVVVSDIYGAMWIFGKKEKLNSTIIYRLHAVVWIGIILTSISGFLLFLPYSSYLLDSMSFRIKMIFVAFIILNSFVIWTHLKVAANHTFASLPWRERVPLLVSGAVSTTGWLGAFIAAQFIGL